MYTLAPGADDPQGPHAEDEVYVVLAGHATLRIDDRDVPVEPGTIAYVAAGVPHHFHAIEQRLRVLVLFAPAESAPTVTPTAQEVEP